MPERQRLLNSWVMELGNYLMSEHDMDKKTAMELAHLNRELITRLGEGRVWFVYRKEDGTEREACGTLCPGISTEFDNYELKDSKKKQGHRQPYTQLKIKSITVRAPRKKAEDAPAEAAE